MSFSGKIKEEIEQNIPSARHCQVAETAALLINIGQIREVKEGWEIRFPTEETPGKRKLFTLLKKTFNISLTLDETVTAEDAERVLEAVRYSAAKDKEVSGLLIKNTCCKRSYIAGLFLATGSMSNPENGYHLEFVCESKAQAAQTMELLKDFEVEAKEAERKGRVVVYIKEADAISELLTVMGAGLSMMDLENVKIVKGIRNSVNRKVNCDTANINKCLRAADRQIEDIEYLQEHVGFKKLPDSLREMAEVRLEYPEMALGELGQMMDPPLGKSGVNHRLRRLSEMAKKHRESREE